MQEMIDLFLDGIPKQVAEMKLSVKTQDWDALYRVAHKIKPGFSMMGIEKVQEDFELLEHSAKNQANRELVADLVEKIENISEKACEELKRYPNE